MKNIILFFLICFCAKTFAQDISSVEKINFYGVDFSVAFLYGLSESEKTIKNGLCDINHLLIREQKKYNVEKYFKKKLNSYCFKSTFAANNAMNIKAMTADWEEGTEISTEQIESIVKKFSCDENNGIGLVFIAESLDKPNRQATYHVVFFNEDTKEIIYSKKAVKKAAGFSVRNYWASTVYKIMKDWKYKK